MNLGPPEYQTDGSDALPIELSRLGIPCNYVISCFCPSMLMFLCGKKEGKTLCKIESRERNYIFQYIGCKGVCKIENNKNVPQKTA